MKGLKENKLNLHMPMTTEDREYDREMAKNMRVFGKITDVFIEENITLEESLILFEAMTSAVQLYMLQGVTFEDVK